LEAWWRTEARTPLEYDTALMPDVIAEGIVREVERFLGVTIPPRYIFWLAAKAEKCYQPGRHFTKRMRSADCRAYLKMFMRHWLDALLGMERPDLHACLPVSFCLGRPLPCELHPRMNRRGPIPDLLPNPCEWDASRITTSRQWRWLVK
jgi:hypothetical protein